MTSVGILCPDGTCATTCPPYNGCPLSNPIQVLFCYHGTIVYFTPCSASMDLVKVHSKTVYVLMALYAASMGNVAPLAVRLYTDVVIILISQPPFMKKPARLSFDISSIEENILQIYDSNFEAEVQTPMLLSYTSALQCCHPSKQF